ncbi:MAG TPA: RnfH family protein [Gammaproteobacteria bacterium]|nr:RnfH family protein [Gammaproteobacteria bacterium]
MGNNKKIKIEVVYALPDEQCQVALTLPEGATAYMALECSELLKKFPEIDLQRQRIGILGSIVKPDYVLEDGQRLEIYRPLTRDPKQARRQRAAEGKLKAKN